MSFLLRMREAAFVARGVAAGPIALGIAPGERVARVFATAPEAEIAALMGAGIVKASTGSVLIDQFDPRVQPAHCKRVVAFVSHAPLPFGDDAEFARYVAYRAALWDLDATRALAHARLLLERLRGMHEAFAYPLAAALAGSPKLVVLDRPERAYAAQILAAVGPLATFSTHLDGAAASAFAAAATDAVLA
ncbi:MAG TPA: hypothetical protein VJP76_03950 [Candidatus Tumulicola sp.]|nr:hypothetical protein [Candidatus Tumulicola sp.]